MKELTLLLMAEENQGQKEIARIIGWYLYDLGMDVSIDDIVRNWPTSKTRKPSKLRLILNLIKIIFKSALLYKVKIITVETNKRV